MSNPTPKTCKTISSQYSFILGHNLTNKPKKFQLKCRALYIYSCIPHLLGNNYVKYLSSKLTSSHLPSWSYRKRTRLAFPSATQSAVALVARPEKKVAGSRSRNAIYWPEANFHFLRHRQRHATVAQLTPRRLSHHANIGFFIMFLWCRWSRNCLPAALL